MDFARIHRILDRAEGEARPFLFEHEGYALLEAMGIATPKHRFLPLSAAELDAGSEIGRETTSVLRAGADLDRRAEDDLEVRLRDVIDAFTGGEVVLKIVSTAIQHKSDVGGVARIPRSACALRAGAVRMLRSVRAAAPEADVAGLLIAERVPFESPLGHELLIGLRWSDDLGPVAVCGPGGIHTELLSRAFREGRDAAILSPHLGPERVGPMLERLAITPLLTAGLRGQEPLLPMEAVRTLLERFLRLARELMPSRIAELEVNPIVVTKGGADGSRSIEASTAAPHANSLIALDVLVRLSGPTAPVAPPRPIQKIDALLHPRSIAVAGVSDAQKNPGRVILDNLLAGGFDRSRLYVIKPGSEEIEGVRCVANASELPERVDLAVLSVAATLLPEMVTELIEQRRAESLIVIPGGLEEKAGSEGIVTRMRAALHRSRETGWGGPVINGGNCLGIQSRPGNYDTLFIPRYKLPVPKGEAAPMVLLCQSGAHMVANLDRLGGIVPRYSISAGNQTDLTVGDYLTFLADDPSIRLFACYVEGFRPLDGATFFRAAEKITASGRTVLLYLAGRTPSGKKASASHTASIAGDYPVLRAISEQAGIVLAKNLGNFADLIQLFVLLRDKEVRGTRLGAISNAGFECVAIADSVRAFQLAEFASRTRARLQRMLSAAHIESIVDVQNPLDLTPMSSDATYEDAVAAILDDEGVDVGVVGIVPLTPALETLEAGPGHGEDLSRESGLAQRLARLGREASKPWIAVVDSGGRFDPFARRLQEQGIPTFRSADRAVKLLETFVAERQRGREQV